jgi:hypothetical protein
MQTVRYRSTRREIWSWYWRMWRRKLWFIHALVLVFCSWATLDFLARRDATLSVSDLIIAALVGAICIAWFPIYPLLRFKPEERTLTIDEQGWSTTIGKISGTRAWKAVRSVEKEGEAIVITGRNLNALIVPRRAFASDAERDEFLVYAQSALAAAG